MTALLEVEALHLAFGGVDVLHGVTFAVPRGGRTALVGPNGAGKTSLFNVVSGVYAPSAGRVVFDGRDISRVPSRHRIGLGISRSFQNIRLMPHLSVVENVMLGQHARARTLGALLSADRATLAFVLAAGGGAASRPVRPWCIPRRVRCQPALWRAQEDRGGAGADGQSGAHAAGRASRRAEPERDG